MRVRERIFYFLPCQLSHLLDIIKCCVLCSSDMEILSLFVSCLCHDLDHRGTNNAFQVSYVSCCPGTVTLRGPT